MVDDSQPTQAPPEGGERSHERRRGDRRRAFRRGPIPWWRRPPALIGSGVLGALLVVLLLNALGDDDEPPAPMTTDAQQAPTTQAPATQAPVTAGTRGATASANPGNPSITPPQSGPATTVGDFEELTIEGDVAVGRRVQARLYCEAPTSVALRANEAASPQVTALVDAAGRVPAASCDWGSPEGEDFLLLLPPDMAETFAGTPEQTSGFQQRRVFRADIEWLGRSSALALRTVGVLRGVL